MKRADNNVSTDSPSAWIDNLLLAEPGKNTEVITVIGSGGKTSLIWHLAASFVRSGRKVLVSPTTKMFPPSKPVPGVTLAGHFNETSGKLESLPPEDLEKLVADHDFALLEGDGAKGLPLKAWAAHEPVVPPFTTLTIGVLPLWPLGKVISEDLAHRLPLFLELTGAAAGERLTQKHILSIITGGKTQPGLFAKARGKKLLFFRYADSYFDNHVDGGQAVKQAREIVEALPVEFRESLSGIICGNLHNCVKACHG